MRLKTLLLLITLATSAMTHADSFYVAYQWKHEEQLMMSWATGHIEQDLDTAEGMIQLILFLQEKRGASGVVITYLKKLKADNPSRLKKEPFKHGRII